MEQKKIIVVDDNQTNLNACKKTLKDLYEVYPVLSAEKMFDVLTHITPDLILMDVEMPGIHGYEAMRMLKSNELYKDIPVIFLSAMDDVQSEVEGLDLGAVDYIHKPFASALLIKRIMTHLSVIESKKEIVLLNQSIANSLNKHDTEEAIKDLLTKGNFLTKMGHELREPLNTVIEMIEAAIKSDDIIEMKSCLGRADVEARLLLEILDDVLDVQS